MRIRVTEQAQEKLQLTIDRNTTGLKLVYDTDGCGCAVNGIARITRIPRVVPEEGEALASEDPYRIYYETRQEVFFEDEIVLDFVPGSGAYSLRSDNQFYNPSFSI